MSKTQLVSKFLFFLIIVTDSGFDLRHPQTNRMLKRHFHYIQTTINLKFIKLFIIHLKFIVVCTGAVKTQFKE